ncbi:hypothetical protein C0W80_18865 [Photobacterium leiognathi subsp. mandapamensis]|uniref:DDE-type integrase/transposase/recombinase n=1 Tax=Photobacterium leiognathi TaxID=553611 RepID=UPI000D170E2E|nr:hypothetical protein C0W80_18865 [Photobacterium leiognathi subsp. mandapamensis]
MAYYYRAVDKFGNVLDYYLSPNRNEAAAKAFQKKVNIQNGLPSKVIIAGSKGEKIRIDPIYSYDLRRWIDNG